MNNYNLYYKNKKLNKNVVDDDIVSQLHSKQYVYKVTTDKYGREYREKIPTKDIKVIKTFVF